MKILSKDKDTLHTYKIISDLNDFTNSNFPIVTIEISEEATIEDHLYAFERFLQSVGFVLPEGTHLDFVENELESIDDEEDDMIIIKDIKDNKKQNKLN